MLILGASGEMGRRIVLLSDRLLSVTRVVIGVHRGNAWPERATHRVDIFDEPGLARALDGMDAVINAVGPYDYDPRPLVSACLAAGCHYVDLAEEPGFIGRVRRTAEARDAATRNIVVLPGCSTLPGLVDVLVQPWAGHREIAAVRVFLSMGSSNPVAPGLMYGMLRPMGRRDHQGHRSFTRLKRRDFDGGATRLHGRFPSPFGPEGILLGERHVPAELWVGFDHLWLNASLLVLARPFSILPDRWLRRAIRAALVAMPAVRRLGTLEGHLAVEALDGKGRTIVSVEIGADREGLNVAALPAVWAVRKLLEGGPPDGGVASLDRLVTFEEASAWLEEEGYTVQRSQAVT